ncbi:right-handed parallel beta-helix repeat-containing protein [bacterium]|nr:right-handed parallel beta-helix repeat-containing protein [bacterium]
MSLKNKSKNLIRINIILTSILIGCLAVPLFAAATYDVSPGESIQSAIDGAKSGDTINVASGEYEESLVIGSGISVQGAGSGKTNLKGYIGVSPIFEPTVTLMDNSSLKGFYIKSSTQVTIKIIGKDVLIENNHIDADFNGIKVEGGSATIQENRIGPYVYAGINFDKSDGSIINNIIETNHIGIILDNSDALILRNIISGRTWHDNRGGNTGISLEKSSPTIKNNIILSNKLDGIFIHSDSNAQIINNTIYDNFRHGILNHHSLPTIMNNIIMSTERGIYNVGDTQPVISYNDVFAWSIGKYLTRADAAFSPSPGTGEISVDPKFYSIVFDDAPGGNFGLDTGSQCINKGNPDGSYNDLDGTQNDIGAYGGPDSGWIGMHELPQIDIYFNGTLFAEGDTLTITVRMTNFNPDAIDVNKFIVLYNQAAGFLFYPSWGHNIDYETLNLSSRSEDTQTLLSAKLTGSVPAGEYTLYAGLSNKNIEFPAGIRSLSFKIVNKPVAKFTVSPKTGKVMITQFNVDASESSDVETPKAVLKFCWRWEDSMSFTDWTTAKKASHKYPSSGTKNITLQVMDLDGFVSSASQTVEVTE